MLEQASSEQLETIYQITKDLTRGHSVKEIKKPFLGETKPALINLPARAVKAIITAEVVAEGEAQPVEAAMTEDDIQKAWAEKA